MRLTNYYKMEKLPGQRSKLRYDCTASTVDYEPFEQRARRGRERRFKFYYGGTPGTFHTRAQRKAECAITDGTSISSVYTPDLSRPLLGYGDVANTLDALLFLFNEDYTQIEIFVARGMKYHARGLFTLFADGALSDEVEALRAAARDLMPPRAAGAAAANVQPVLFDMPG